MNPVAARSRSLALDNVYGNDRGKPRRVELADNRERRLDSALREYVGLRCERTGSRNASRVGQRTVLKRQTRRARGVGYDCVHRLNSDAAAAGIIRQSYGRSVSAGDF